MLQVKRIFSVFFEINICFSLLLSNSGLHSKMWNSSTKSRTIPIRGGLLRLFPFAEDAFSSLHGEFSLLGIFTKRMCHQMYRRIKTLDTEGENETHEMRRIPKS
jgi:hypothetical protein